MMKFATLCEQVYSELSAKPYAATTGSDGNSTALTGVTNEKFPDLSKWILKTIRDNKVFICSIIHSESWVRNDTAHY